MIMHEGPEACYSFKAHFEDASKSGEGLREGISQFVLVVSNGTQDWRGNVTSSGDQNKRYILIAKESDLIEKSQDKHSTCTEAPAVSASASVSGVAPAAITRVCLPGEYVSNYERMKKRLEDQSGDEDEEDEALPEEEDDDEEEV